MKFLVTIFLSLFVSTIYAQLVTNVVWTEKSSLPPSEVIYYSATKDLTWSDFKGTPPESRASAVTVSGFGYQASINTRNGRGTLNISVYCYFNKNKSWVKPGKNTSYILNHEQHHFNISYVAARIFADKLQKAVFTTSNYNALIQNIYTESCDIMNKMQNDYDGQTKNGQLKDVQSKWNEVLEEKINILTK